MVDWCAVHGNYTEAPGYAWGFMTQYSTYSRRVLSFDELEIATALNRNTGPNHYLAALEPFDFYVFEDHGLTWALGYSSIQFTRSCVNELFEG